MPALRCLRVVRLALCPLFVVAFLLGGAGAGAFVVAVAMGVAGAVERRWARRAAKGERGAAAALLEDLPASLTDTATRLTIYLCFLGAGLAPLWVVVVVFYCDTVATYLRVARVAEAPAGSQGPRPSVGDRVRRFAEAVVVLAVFWRVFRTDFVDPFAVAALERTAHWLMAVVGVVTLAWVAERLARSLPALRGVFHRKA